MEHTHARTRTCTHTYTNMHTQAHTHIYKHAHTHTHTHTHTRTHTHTHTPTHTHTLLQTLTCSHRISGPEYVAMIESVTVADIKIYMERVLSTKPSLAVMGPGTQELSYDILLAR